MGIYDLIAKVSLIGIRKNPQYQKLQKDYDDLIERSKALKEIDPDYTNETFEQYQNYKTYLKYEKFFNTLFDITSIIFNTLFLGSFFYLFIDFSGALRIMFGSFLGSIGWLISPLGAKFDLLDSFSVVRLVLCMPILCFNLLVFSGSWLILVPLISLLSLIVAFILNKVYI